MGISVLDVQRDAIIASIRSAGRGEWKILVTDEGSWKLLQNVVSEDEILNQRIANIEQIEQRRQQNLEMDAIYILSPEPYIVDCLMADLERRRYRKASVLWTSLLHASLRQRIDKSRLAQEQIIQLQVIDIGFFPRESNLITFRDPWSFPILFHPSCNNLVRQHLSELAQKIVSVCVSLGEYPTIRYYRPRTSAHEASILCSHLARFVQDEIDMYATYHKDFPPPSSRPRGVLYILDRSMDLIAPLIHEFSYQAMVHDLLPVKEGDKITYRMMVTEGSGDQEEKDVEISEKDKIWVANRHQHMKDTIEKLMGDFQKFIDENPHFTKTDSDGANSLGAIKDMLAGLPEFQEMKGAYSLHLAMAQDCMNIFQQRKLPDLASIEQTLATGLDEDHKKPKGVADQVIRLLDEDSIVPPDRLRLILMYLLFKDGLVPADATKLLAHAQLSPQSNEAIRNLSLLGAKTERSLKEKAASQQQLFPPKPATVSPQEEYSLSRFEPGMKRLLDAHHKGTLDQNSFPFTKPQLEPQDGGDLASTTSLRGAKPTWAKTRTATTESKQRVVVFMAGGATYSESRACYEISNTTNKDVYLMTSHMLTPGLFVRQVSDLSENKRKLGIPAEQPKRTAPSHLFEPIAPPPSAQPAVSQSKPQSPPSAQMNNLNLNSSGQAQNGHAGSSSRPLPPAPAPKAPEPEKKKKGLFRSKK